MESDWRRRYETEKAQLKLAASQEKMELVERLQEEHREQLRAMRENLIRQYENVSYPISVPCVFCFKLKDLFEVHSDVKYSTLSYIELFHFVF